MRVVTTPEASAFIASRGGVAYIRPLTRKCCGGAMTTLAATTDVPADASVYEAVGDPALGVRYWRTTAGDEPFEMLLELRGRRRPRLAACWDGCAFKM